MMDDIGRRARAASRDLAALSTAQKNEALLACADAVEAAAGHLIAANSLDMEQAREEGVTGALLDRQLLTPARVTGMAGGLRKVAALPDPVGLQTGGWRLYNGIRLQRIRVPLGVVAVKSCAMQSGANPATTCRSSTWIGVPFSKCTSSR